MTSNVPDTVSPAAIIRLGTAFCQAKTVLSAVELGLFTALHDGPATAGQLCDRLDLHPRGTTEFLGLLVALGLLERADGRYRNSAGADRHLVSGEPFYVGGFLERASQNLYPAWGHLTEALRTGRPQAETDFTHMIRDPSKLRRFLGMMDALTGLLAPELVQAFDWSMHASVADIGGARGNLVAHLVKAHPHLEAHVFDLPHLEPFFHEHMTALGLAEKVQFWPGDFFAADPLPQADVLILGHVLHDWAPQERQVLADKAFQTIQPGGALLVYDRMLDEELTDPENLVISLDMLLTTRGGSEYTAHECRGYLETAGFAATSAQPLGDHDILVIGRKPR
jgi:hypothetical protein